MSELNEDKINIEPDSFATNDNVIHDETANVATYHAIADVSQSGGGLDHFSFIKTNNISITSIKDYLARPRLMYSGSATTYNASMLLATYAFDFLSQAEIQEKIKYFNLVRGTFQIKLVCTAAPYAAGIVSMSSYYGDRTMYGPIVGGDEFKIINLAQKTRVDLDLGSANTSMLSIPLHIFTPYVRNGLPDNGELKTPKVELYTLTPLSNTQTNTAVTVYYKLYISLVDAEIVVPIPDVGVYTSAKKNETNVAAKGVISYPASIVADVGKALSKIPVIGRFALATSMLATAVKDVAILFGFSRPRDLSKVAYPHALWTSSGLGEVRVKNLTLDPKQEVTIDVSPLGEVGDSLTFQNIVGRYGVLDTFVWNTTNVAEDKLFRVDVNPCVCPTYDDMSLAFPIRYYNPTPLAFASTLFLSWRGTLKYKFTFPANRFIRGKLRIFWCMNSASITSLSLISHNALSVLVDFSSSAEVEIVVPWMVENMYLPVLGLHSFTHQQIASNGELVVMVEEPLITNNASYIQQCVVSVCAGEDFELAIPSMADVSFLNFTPIVDPYAEVGAQNGDDLKRPTNNTQPFLFDWALYTSGVVSNTNNPVSSGSFDLLPGASNDKAAIIHMGERFNTFRPLLKRFHPYRTGAFAHDTGKLDVLFFPYLPSPLGQSLNLATGTVQAYPVCNTPIAYFSRMFGGVRGSIRYDLECVNQSCTGVFASRGFSYGNTDFQLDINDASWMTWAQTHFQAGISWFKGVFEPLAVELPFQNFHWFYQTFDRDFWASDTTDKIYGVYLAVMGADQYVVNCAAGEDFQFVLYNGPPMMASLVPGLVAPP